MIADHLRNAIGRASALINRNYSNLTYVLVEPIRYSLDYSRAAPITSYSRIEGRVDIAITRI